MIYTIYMDKKHKLLLVEDDGFLASIFAQKFELEGFEVAYATNGEDGLKLAKKDKPDIILLDLLMPKMDGFETLAALKKDDGLKDVPVLVLSNLGGREDVERCIKLGAAGYLIKAHSLPHETVNKVKELLHA